jgi:ABC-type multidrug transport system fused ATPase/permease subunit
MPVWLAWLRFISPYYWAVTALSNNEFGAPVYDVPAPGSSSGQTQGELFMSQFNFPLSTMAKWGGIMFLYGLFLLIAFVAAPLALTYIRYDTRPGTRRLDAAAGGVEGAPSLSHMAATGSSTIAKAEGTGGPATHYTTGAGGLAGAAIDATGVGLLAGRAAPSYVGTRDDRDGGVEAAPTAASTGAPEQVAVPVGATGPAAAVGSTAAGAIPSAAQAASAEQPGGRRKPIIPFTPVTLAFRDVRYSVTTTKGEERPLLRGVSGYARPYTLTALMGASGAGKTTLQDCLSGRKTTGTLTGNIRLKVTRRPKRCWRARPL